MMYLESFGNPAKFLALAREVTRQKPLFIVKSGRTRAGARAAASHTGSLAGTDAAVDALLTQSGVIRAETVEELFDLAMAFDNQPIPRGDRVAIVSNAGGPGIIIADTCEARGLTVTELSADTQSGLRAALPDEASVRNPVDLIASARAESYELALDAVLADDGVDAAIAAFVPPLGIQARDVAAAIVRVKQRHQAKPVLAVLMGRQGLPAGLAELHAADVPGYIFPESAARALAAMDRYRRWLDRPPGAIVEFPSADERLAALFERVRAAGRAQLLAPEAMELLEAIGVPTAAWAVAGDPAEARAAAEKLGFPVALKAVSERVIHKTDVGGVALGLVSPAETEEACRQMLGRVRERTGADDAAVLVQRMVQGRREVIVGTSLVPRFGHLVMFGLGGIYVEAMEDVVFRVSPLSDQDAREMTRGLRGSRLLAGIRGEPSVDFSALEEVLLRVSQLVQRHPMVVELDVNPIMALPDGAVAVDARVSLAEGAATDEASEERAEAGRWG
jgi:acetyltransferase